MPKTLAALPISQYPTALELASGHEEARSALFFVLSFRTTLAGTAFAVNLLARPYNGVLDRDVRLADPVA